MSKGIQLDGTRIICGRCEEEFAQPDHSRNHQCDPIKVLVLRWREYNSQQTNEGFDMPVDKSFRGFMEWLEDNTK